MVVDDTATNIWNFIIGNIGPVSTIIVMGASITKYLEKKIDDKIKGSEKFILVNIDGKFESIDKDVKQMKESHDTIRRYMENDIKDLKEEIIRLRSHDYTTPDYSIRNRYEDRDQNKDQKRR